MSRQFATENTSTSFVSSSGGSLAVLLISPDDEDCASLERILKPEWNVVSSATFVSGLSILRNVTITLVICDCDITSITWVEALDRISLLADPPLFIVTSRLADDYLWAEALNLGAFDVLAKPFDGDEVIRVVGSALRHWQHRNDFHNGTQRKAVTGTKYLAATGT